MCKRHKPTNRHRRTEGSANGTTLRRGIGGAKSQAFIRKFAETPDRLLWQQ
jgi:hypothetical protein